MARLLTHFFFLNRHTTQVLVPGWHRNLNVNGDYVQSGVYHVLHVSHAYMELGVKFSEWVCSTSLHIMCSSIRVCTASSTDKHPVHCRTNHAALIPQFSVTLTLLASCHSVQKALNLNLRLNVSHPYKMAARLYNCRRRRGRIHALSYNLSDYIYGTPCRYRVGSHSPGASSASVVTVTQDTVASAWCSNYWDVLIGLFNSPNKAANMKYV